MTARDAPSHDPDTRARTVAPRASVLVPAHDESGRIGRTLRGLLADAEPGEFEVVVVCNGCTDRTADEAREVGGVRVVEIPDASKIAALREGERWTTVFPRLYLDGDVVVDTDTARRLADALTGGDALAAGVPGRPDLAGSSFGAQLFVEFRQRLPVFRAGIIGAGVYGLSERGRARFHDWPDVLGDDQFVYRLFAPHERVTLADASTRVAAPRTLRDVIRRGIRVRRGNRQLTAGIAGQPPLSAPPAGLAAALRESLRSPRGWLSAAVFVAVTLVIRVLAGTGRRGDWG